MGEEIIVEDYMLEEIDTMKYYLSNEEFEDTMLHLEDHKPKYITVGKPIEFVTIKRRVFYYTRNFNEFGVAGTSYSSSTCEESLDLCKRKQQLALQAIAEYYDGRGLKRKLGFAGLGNDEERRCLKRKLGFAGLGNDEDGRQCSRKKTVIEDWGYLDILADACCTIASVKPVIRLKIIPPAAKPVVRLKVISPAVENRSEIRKVTSRNPAKIKKKKGKDTTNYDVPVVKVLPPEYLEKIRKLNGRNFLLIEQKQLTASDVNQNLGRLLLNQKKSVMKEFLKDAEEKTMGMKDGYITAKLLEPMGRNQDINVTKWNMVQNSYYVLLKTWNQVVASNGFGKNDVVQVWTFRFDDKVPDQLGVAVVRIFTAPRESSTCCSSADGCGSSSLCSS